MQSVFTSLKRRLARCLALGFLVLGVSTQAQAQTAPAPNSCAPVERELDAMRQELDRARSDLDSARARAQDADAARATLERIERELAESTAAANSCQSAEQALCSAAGSFARGLGAGRVNAGGLGSCIDPGDQSAISEQLSGVANVTAAMAQFGAFSAGESDVPPRLGPLSGSKVEKLVARLFAQGNGSPLVYRRLLIEAMMQVVPRSWSAIKIKPGNVDRWFSSRDPLDDSMVAEAHEGATAAHVNSSDPAALSSALGLVGAYQMLARCNGPTPARDCGRAGQLRQMLESSGPLITRRRIQDVWASECSSLTDAVVLQWLSDLPAARTSVAQTEAVAQAIHFKTFTCFLRDSTAGNSFSAWLSTRLPSSKTLTTRTLGHLLKLEESWQPGSSTDRCAHAVRALQTLPTPSECSVAAHLVAEVTPWSSDVHLADAAASFGFGVCDRLARSLWAGNAATLPNAFPAPPTVEDAVRLVPEAPPTTVERLRTLCDEAAGQGTSFEAAVKQLGTLGRGLGENPALGPWNLDLASMRPVVTARIPSTQGTLPWLKSFTNESAACNLLELGQARCQACRELPEGTRYDCSLLESVENAWSKRTKRALVWSLLALGLVLILTWAVRLRRALKLHGAWLSQAENYLRSIELEPHVDRFRYLFPSRLARLEVALPKTHAWERWGERAAIVRSAGTKLQGSDINRAGMTAQAFNAQLALLVHEESVSPDLGAVRAMLEWAARGNKAVQVLPIPWSRLKWSRGAMDLLELAEESSLRSNPFEVRGRVTSSSQFFDRERLVSGLLAGAQAGHFTVVTGLRRFGKSSLALEVARRLPGPSAYVDLAGFHHEIRFSTDPADAADAILRFLCLKLLESAQARSPDAALELAVPDGKMDAATLTVWFREFGRVVAAAEKGKAPPVLLILDEIEQAIGAAKELNHALDVFAILVGRLRNSLPGTSHEGGQRVGLLFCSALHPLLWSPLGTLAHQSLIGSFEYVSVPCLPDEAAASMMRGLGSRQGIRFTDAALALLVQESQSVPLLLRRLGTAVLELYDPERARQGGLGAVEIGIEGVRAAIEREETEGSPLRVWVESEIADPSSPGGAVLRSLSTRDWLPAGDLRAIAARAFRQQFEITGVALALTPEEAIRRAEEAAGVVIRMLGDCGLLRSHGDAMEPDGYELPDGVIRRVLSAAETAS